MGKLPFIVCLIIAAAFCGCSPQHKFAQRFAEADRVIATNEARAFGIEVTSVEPKKIVEAISSARKQENVAATPYLRLEFFKGTNSLGTVYTLEKCVMMKLDGEKRPATYIDSSGVLQAVDSEFSKK